MPRKPVTIPEPPPAALTPRSRVAVATSVTGRDAARLHLASAPGQRDFAERIGADYVVLTHVPHPPWPMSVKFGVGPLLDVYERVLYLDADVCVPPDAVDPLALCPPEAFGACCELEWCSRRGLPRYLAFRNACGLPELPAVPYYCNLGVFVASACHRDLLRPPPYPIVTGHCAEQDWTMGRLHDSGCAVCLLPRECNWQWWTDPVRFRDSPPGTILHYSGAGNHRTRARLIARRSRLTGANNGTAR